MRVLLCHMACKLKYTENQLFIGQTENQELSVKCRGIAWSLTESNQNKSLL